jgi:hypothetical protein
VVPVQPRLHAKGPLVYGVFGALLSELTVLEAHGSTVYTKNLHAKATEATQFCEGYAEPFEKNKAQLEALLGSCSNRLEARRVGGPHRRFPFGLKRVTRPTEVPAQPS